MEDQFIILASDGLWDVFESQEAVDFVKIKIDEAVKETSESATPFASFENKVARQLIDEALEKGSTDNITVQIVLL